MAERCRGKRKAERRVIYIPNISSGCALAVAATVARRSANSVRGFLHRYLGRESIFSATTSTWGFFLEFHVPYHALREDNIEDPRTIHGKRVRKSSSLPLKQYSNDQQDLYYHQAQTSSLSWGNDEDFWTDIFLVDTYFGSEDIRKNYFSRYKEEDGMNPPLGGQGCFGHNPQFDPRECFLRKLHHRTAQVATEYSALIETFNERMEVYAETIKDDFQDTSDMSHTKTISRVIETIHVFADTISGIVDAWEAFRYSGLAFFRQHTPEKVKWPPIISTIMGNITELARLRKLLLTKREWFKFKLESFHTVSSLSQAENAILQANVGNTQAKEAVSQGSDLRILTQMTVYVAFPLLFTTAFFSMEFANPPYPWAVFVGVLFGVFLLNYMIASQSTPKTAYTDARMLMSKAWTNFVRWLRTLT